MASTQDWLESAICWTQKANWKQQGSQIAEKNEKRNRVSHISVAKKAIWRQNSLTWTYIETSPEVGIATAKAPVSTDTKTKETKQRARFAEPFLSLWPAEMLSQAKIRKLI